LGRARATKGLKQICQTSLSRQLSTGDHRENSKALSLSYAERMVSESEEKDLYGHNKFRNSFFGKSDFALFPTHEWRDRRQYHRRHPRRSITYLHGPFGENGPEWRIFHPPFPHSRFPSVWVNGTDPLRVDKKGWRFCIAYHPARLFERQE